MADCLIAIQQNPELRPIFHPIHILNSARLRHGYRVHCENLNLIPKRKKPVDITHNPEEVSSLSMFGGDHPVPFTNNGSKRVKWTFEENNWIHVWCENRVREVGHDNNIAAHCLKAIREDPEAWPIFHPNHVLNSSKLNEGRKSYIKRLKKIEAKHFEAM